MPSVERTAVSPYLPIPIEIIPRHVHLSTEDHDRLFGVGAKLTVLSKLSQRGQVVYRETLTVIGKNGEIESIFVLGPCRKETQVELSSHEATALGIGAPVRLSGDIARTPGCTLEGPAGEIKLKRGVIVPVSHLHATPAEAEKMGIKNGDEVSVKIPGAGDENIENVVVRVHPTFHLSLHITSDMASSLWIPAGAAAYVQPSRTRVK